MASEGPRKPAPLNAAVTVQMKRMPRRDSFPELRVRRALHHRGLRFRVQGALPGRPDIVFSRAKIAVFIDGCFWHQCPDHSSLPKNNAEWWSAKLGRNVTRDREKDEALRILGWEPVHVWEHEDPEAAADRIERLWRSRTPPRTTNLSAACGILEDEADQPD